MQHELKDKEFLLEYLDAHSPSGFEGEGQKIWKDQVKKFSSKIEEDCHNNVVATIFNNVGLRNTQSSVVSLIEKKIDFTTSVTTKYPVTLNPQIHTTETFDLISLIRSESPIEEEKLDGSKNLVDKELDITLRRTEKTPLFKSKEIKSPFKVMIEAHSDEISYIITKINPDGLIYVIRNGGSDEQIAPSKKVLIHTSKGKIPAVFGWIAIHIRERNIHPDKDSIFLDAGFNSKDEVLASGISVGNMVTFDEKAIIMNDKVVGKSLDNKIGGYIIAQVGKRISEFKESNLLNFDLLIANSVQEEVGLLGATLNAHNHKPDIAIVTDVTHDTTTPGIINKLIGDIAIGRGPVLVTGAAISQPLLNVTKSVNDDYQLIAHSGRGTGTDADVFSYANGGTPTILIKMPLRYMHTSVEMVSISDINKTIELMYQTLVKLNDIDPEMIKLPNQNAY